MKNRRKFTMLKWQQSLLLGFALFILIIFCGYYYYRYEKTIIRQEKFNNLKFIADLKINQITHWRKERLADAHVFTESPFIRQSIQRWLLSKGKNIEKDLIERILLMRNNYNYEDAFIFSSEGKLLSDPNTTLKHIDPVTINYCTKALQDRETFFSDLYFSPTDNIIHFDIISPISNDRNIPVAVLVLRVNPYNYLYPLIQSWPTSSKSAETLIVRKDGDSVLFINDLRHISNTALKLRIPLTNTKVPAVQAVLGHVGIWEGIDYRGIKVLADIRPVPGSPWFMIAKVDQSEVFTELRFRSTIIIIITLILLLFLGFGISWLYNNRQKNIYRKLLETGTALQESQEVFRATLYSIGEGVITTDIQGCIRHMNFVAEKLTGWNEHDAAGRSIKDVFHIVDEESRDKVESPVQRVLKEGSVAGFANHTLLISKDGKEISIADNGAPIRNDKNEIIGVVLVFRDQTEERASQKAIRQAQEAEQLLAHTIRSIGELISITDLDDRFTFVNQAFLDKYGYTYEEIIGQRVSVIVSPKNDPELLKEVLEYSRKSGWTGEVLDITKDGREFPISLKTSNILNEKGEILGLVGVAEDITERKLAEAFLQKSEERFRSLYENSTIGLYRTTPEGKIILANPTLVKMLGYPTFEELASKNLEEEGFEPSYERKQFIEQIELNGEVIGLESAWTCRDGSILNIKESARAIKAPNGKVLYYDGTVEDISERKKAEALLRKSEEKYRDMVEQINDVIYATDTNGIITYVSPTVEILSGYKPEEITDHSLGEFVGPTVFFDIKEHFRKIMAGILDPLEYQVKMKSGELRWLRISSRPIINENRPIGVRGVLTDITEHKQAENEIHHLNETLEKRVVERTHQLEILNKELDFHIKEIEQLTFIASHDLQEPLRTLTTFTQLIHEEYSGKLDEDGNKYIEFIFNSATRMRLLVKGLLDYSLLGRESIITIVDCNKILNEVISDMSESINLYEAKITVQELPVLNGSETELRLLFQNLIHNAIKFRKKDVHPEINISAKDHENEWVFAIEDNGIGIEGKDKVIVFNIFQRTHNRSEFEGSGIGLAHCKKIVELHGGRIWVESAPNAGSVFIFTIPKR